MSEKQIDGRTAKAFEFVGSEAVINLTTYRFGQGEQSTRPDRVLRIPTAAIVVHKRGRAIEYSDSGKTHTLPKIALLGADSRARIWATRPGTEFMMVNLAPGTVRVLFGVDPKEITNQTKSLEGHEFSGFSTSGQNQGPATLIQKLDRLLSQKNQQDHKYFANDRRRIGEVLRSLRDRQFGERVCDYADHFGVTSRTLQRLVRAEVGLSPKQVLSVTRLRAMITLTRDGWTQSTAQLAQDGGFFDQSHLRHEVLRRRFGKLDNLVSGDHLVAVH